VAGRPAVASSGHGTRTGSGAPSAPGIADRAMLSAGPHRILFIGASYTQGLGASTPEHGYAYLTGARLGWPTEVSGVSGTGYLNPGPHDNGTFAARIARMPQGPQPSVVVLQGGRNDVGYARPALRTAVVDTIELARRHFPGAEIILLGPIPARVPVDQATRAAEATLRDASTQCEAPFVDPIAEHWITQRNQRGYLGLVPGHPDNAGYAYIAHRLAADLASMEAPAPGSTARSTARPTARSTAKSPQ
ncbi:MAG TPA: SGNH/GDSL hydrolase family protein, partial [Jatrophihabitantaceae bacterium]|nr:SGNH/GDSL hydrolase family protein [Jatrophihabitantaceae bacterium]